MRQTGFNLYRPTEGIHERGAQRGHQAVRGDELEERWTGVASIHLELHMHQPPRTQATCES
jgi:hypothetical protein